MDHVSRRQVVRGGTAAALTVAAPSIHAQTGRQTLRFIAEADLRILDPIWTTAYITRNHGYLVYDTLFGTDENQRIQPQMVERTSISPDGMRYKFTLRDGLRWHDGKPVLSLSTCHDLAIDRPDEGRQLTRDCGGDHGWSLAFPRE